MSIAGDTPLIAAARHGRSEIVTKLLEYGEDVNEAKAGTGDTPLIIACYHGRSEIVDKLLAARADVNQANRDGAAPLYVASLRGHLEVPPRSASPRRRTVDSRG